MDSIFFWLSKIIWLLISPDSFIYFLILLSGVFLYINKVRLAKIFFSISILFLTIIAFFPVGEWLLYPLESRFESTPALPAKIDGIIVLSGGENPLQSELWQQVEVNGAAERNLAFMHLAREYPEAQLVFTGGTGSLVHQGSKGADVAKKLFQQQGFDVSRIIFERESRNTYENAVLTKKLINPDKGSQWILITTGWHMPRSAGIFCKENWPVIPYPVDHTSLKNNLLRIDFDLAGNLRGLKIALKEWTGLLAYRLTGKTNSLFPSGCH